MEDSRRPFSFASADEQSGSRLRPETGSQEPARVTRLLEMAANPPPPLIRVRGKMVENRWEGEEVSEDHIDHVVRELQNTYVAFAYGLGVVLHQETYAAFAGALATALLDEQENLHLLERVTDFLLQHPTLMSPRTIIHMPAATPRFFSAWLRSREKKKRRKKRENEKLIQDVRALTPPALLTVVQFLMPPPLSYFWWKGRGPWGTGGSDEVDGVRWGELYRIVLPAVWSVLDDFPLEEVWARGGVPLLQERAIPPGYQPRIVRLNAVGEHDPRSYYYLWAVVPEVTANVLVADDEDACGDEEDIDD